MVKAGENRKMGRNLQKLCISFPFICILWLPTVPGLDKRKLSLDSPSCCGAYELLPARRVWSQFNPVVTSATWILIRQYTHMTLPAQQLPLGQPEAPPRVHSFWLSHWSRKTRGCVAVASGLKCRILCAVIFLSRPDSFKTIKGLLLFINQIFGFWRLYF